MKTTLIAALTATASLIALPALADGKNNGEIDMPFESDSSSLSDGMQEERSSALGDDYTREGFSDKEREGYDSPTPEFETDSGISGLTTADDAAGN